MGRSPGLAGRRLARVIGPARSRPDKAIFCAGAASTGMRTPARGKTALTRIGNRGHPEPMVRPVSCTRLAGESPVRVSAGAPGSRPQLRGIILGVTARRQEPHRWEQGSGPQPSQVNAAASSQDQPKGVREGRAAHVTAKAIDKDEAVHRQDCSGFLERGRAHPDCRPRGAA